MYEFMMYKPHTITFIQIIVYYVLFTQIYIYTPYVIISVCIYIIYINRTNVCALYFSYFIVKAFMIGTFIYVNPSAVQI